jgi:CRP/FNR family transcriptional regulator, cyclic AMP receptor protein
MNPVIDTDILIAWGAVYRQFRKGDYIFKEDTPAYFYHQVETGSVKMVNCNDQGKEFIQGMFEAGESFGEPPLFFDGVYPASAVAEADCTILKLRKESFLEILKDRPDAHLGLTKALANRLFMKAIVSRELACHQPEHRIITILDMVREREQDDQGEKIKVPYTRQQIADMTGLRVETVIRTIRNLEQKGLLEIQGGKVFIPAKLMTERI